MDKLEIISPMVIKEIGEQRIGKLGKIKKPINTVFEYDIDTGNINKADFIESITKGENNKLYIKDNKIYIDALNKENAIKRLLKRKILFHTLKPKTNG